MNDNKHLHKFIPDYPLQDDELIQWKIAQREEFRNLAANIVDKKNQKYFNHQLLLQRIMREYDRVFMYHETGTGKSASIVGVAEMFKKNPEFGIRRAFILEPGPSTVENFKEQIILHSGKNEYANEKTLRTDKVQILKRNITNMVKKFYDINTYESFSREVAKYSDARIREEYSDSFFFFDEIHTIRNLSETSKDKENKYESLWRVLHVARRIKVVIGSATPLINTERDFVGMLNLLLPSDSQLPFGWEYKNVTMSQIEPYIRGKITYLRGSDTEVEKIKIGETVDHSFKIKFPKEEMGHDPIIPVKKWMKDRKIITTKEPIQPKIPMSNVEFKSSYVLKLLKMGDIQEKSYLKTLNDCKKKCSSDLNDDSLTSDVRGTDDAFYRNMSYTSLFVFPDGSYGERGWKKNMIKEGGVWKMRPHFQEYFSSQKKGLETLKNCGCKYHFLISNEIKKKGKSFGYCEYVKYAGTDLLQVLLEQFEIDGEKFENFTDFGNIFYTEPGTNKKRILPSIKKKPRFGIFTSNTHDTDSLLKLYNSEENIDGEYLKIIIVTRTGRDGINVLDTIRNYMITPDWHESGMHQAKSRADRVLSHDRYKKKYGKATLEEYNLAAIPSSLKNGGATVDDSIDVKKYLRAEKKDITQQRLLNSLKLVAYDALINYRRNFRLTDEPFSKETGYQDRLPETWAAAQAPNPKSDELAYSQGPSPEDIIRTTNDIYYSEEDVGIITRAIRKILTRNKILLISEIFKMDYRKPNILKAISKVIEDKDPIFDAYKNPVYVKLQGNVLFLSRNFNDVDDTISSNYTEFYPINEVSLIEDIIDEEKVSGKIEEIFEEIKGMEKSEIQEYLVKFSPDILRNLFEEAYIRKNKNILDLFSLYIHTINFPKNSLELAKKKMREPQVGKRGHPRNEVTLKSMRSLEKRYTLGKKEDGKVTFHFYQPGSKGTSYGMKNLFTRSDKEIRLFDENKGEWRDGDLAEISVYNWISLPLIRKIMEKYTEKKIFGTRILRDGKFRINIVKGTHGFEEKNIVCETIGEKGILEIFVKLPISEEDLGEIQFNREKIEEIVDMKNLSDIELKRAYFWYKNKSKKKKLCNFIEKFFKKEGRLFVTF